MNNNKTIPQIIEIVFDIIYIITVISMGIYFVFLSTDKMQNIWGIMAFVLIFGDIFHLAPRIMTAYTGEKKRFTVSLGIGKAITSITMTFFYLLLWHIGIAFSQKNFATQTIIMYILAIVRIAICLLPQNNWKSPTPSYKYGIYRNIPFAVQGMMVAIFYFVNLAHIPALKFMWIAIILSFAFYLPVVLFAHKNPKFGMFMLPKTCVYVWIIAMGFFIA